LSCPWPRWHRVHRSTPVLNAIQTLFTGTIAKVASLVAIVIGGYGFAHGEPGAKKALAGVAAGTGIAVLAVNVLSWLWGV
jgi:type IV secretory pathway VirB2 component (pilin)